MVYNRKKWPTEFLRLKEATIIAGDWLAIDGQDFFTSPNMHVKRLDGRTLEKDKIAAAVKENIRLDEPIIPIGGYYNFYHNLVDYMLSYFYIKDFEEKDIKLVTLTMDQPFHIPTIEFLGIPRSRLIEVPLMTAVSAPEIILAPRAIQKDGYVRDIEAINWIRSMAGGDPGKRRRLLISRRKASSRHISNEAELFDQLQPLGFEIVLLEDLTISEQARTFREAEFVVAPHGAGLANIIFMEPGTGVIELKTNRGRDDFAFRHLTSGIGMDHKELYFNGAFRGSMFKVNVSRVMKALKQSPRLA